MDILKTCFLLSAYSSAVWNAASWEIKEDATIFHATHFHFSMSEQISHDPFCLHLSFYKHSLKQKFCYPMHSKLYTNSDHALRRKKKIGAALFMWTGRIYQDNWFTERTKNHLHKVLLQLLWFSPSLLLIFLWWYTSSSWWSFGFPETSKQTDGQRDRHWHYMIWRLHNTWTYQCATMQFGK